MDRFDLIVVGGGQAGSAAALAAARQGLKVLLAEATGSLGGSATMALVLPYMGFKTRIYKDGDCRILWLSDGIFREIHDALNDDEIYGYRDTDHRYHEETMKVLYDRKMAEAGVTVLFHATLCGVERDGRALKSVSFATVGGIYTFSADTYIDATGDATLTAMAGSPYQLGRASDSLCQPMTLCFRMGNVDMDAYEKMDGDINRLYKQYQAEGKIKNPRENVLIFHTRVANMLHFNTTRIIKLNPTDPFDRSRAEAEAREQVVEMYHFLKDNFDAFKNADLLMTAPEIGVRESRMIDARHVLTSEDLFEAIKFEDAIAAGNYEIDIHSPDGSGTYIHKFPAGVYYTIPYRSLQPKDLDNLLVAGRCIGATHEAQAAVRIMPICTCMGEAAGIAAAIAKEDGVTVGDADAKKIRARLREVGAFVGEH